MRPAPVARKVRTPPRARKGVGEVAPEDPSIDVESSARRDGPPGKKDERRAPTLAKPEAQSASRVVGLARVPLLTDLRRIGAIHQERRYIAQRIKILQKLDQDLHKRLAQEDGADQTQAGEEGVGGGD